MSLVLTKPSISIGEKYIEKVLNRFGLIRSILDETINTELLIDYVEKSNDFPDIELANNIEKASKEFRHNFKLRPAT